MPNDYAFRPVVPEKIFKYLLRGPKKDQPLYLNTSESPGPNDASYQVRIKLALCFLRRSFHEKIDRRTTDEYLQTCNELNKTNWINLSYA